MIRDDAIVTRLIEYGDTDLVVRLFTRQHGRLGAFARAARRSKKRFGGSLAALATGEAALKPHRGDGLAQLTSFEAEPFLFGLAEPQTLGRASYLVELTDRLLPEAEPCPSLFGWLGGALASLAHGAGGARLLRAYELQLLAETGYLPDLDNASDLAGEEPVAIDPQTGALVADPGAGCVDYPARARAAAAALLRSTPSALPDLDEDTLRITGRLFAVHLRRLDVQDLKSVAFLRSLAQNPG